MHRIAKWFLMAGLLAFLFSRTALCVVDLDLWHELALAREVMRLGHVPWQDHFAFTPKLDLVVPSVLLDAGAGAAWTDRANMAAAAARAADWVLLIMGCTPIEGSG